MDLVFINYTLLHFKEYDRLDGDNFPDFLVIVNKSFPTHGI